METNRTVPYNVDAEKYVLGSVFFDNQIITGLVGRLAESDFYDERNQILFKAMVSLHANNKKIELLTVTEELEHLNYQVTEEFKHYVIDVIESVPTVSTTNLYVELVEEKALERKLLSDMKNISDDILYNKLSFQDLLDKAEDKIINVIKKRKTSDIITMSQASEQVYKQIEKFTEQKSGLTGLSSGFKKVNEVTLGLQRGDLMILAARPSVGKSAYAINLALNVAKENNAHVAFFSLEMSIEQLMMRIYAKSAEVALTKIRTGDLTPEDLILLGLARQELANTNLYFDETSSNNLSDIRTKCRQLKNEGKLDFVVIDYLQLITTKSNRGSRQEEVSQISRNLKTLARDLEVPVLALSQLSRSIEGREDKRPVLADLRESGSIEQDADLVMFLFRRSDVEEEDTESVDYIQSELNDRVNEMSGKPKNNNQPIEIVLSIAKNRQGSLGYFDYHFYGNVSRFVEQSETKPLIKKKKKAKKQK